MKYVLFLLPIFLFFSCSNHPKTPSSTPSQSLEPYVTLTHPEWSKNASIYEVNIRQFTPEGTFKAFESHLPRLKSLGVDILWLMPIHPIGEKNRKGSLGSYYAVKDYYAVNPEFGTMEEFKALVDKIHDMGMYVIIDWVANHSAWDNPLVEAHPEWYSKGPDGNFQPTPWYDWDDIIDFNYEHPGIRNYMTEVLEFWVKETDIDGYRCDVAGFIPVSFWNNVRERLDAIKPVFMLAEWESRDLHAKAFDMTYSWSLYETMHSVVKGHATLAPLNEYMAHHVNTFPKNGYRMLFVDNHDKNSWTGTPFSQFGNALDASMVLTGTMEGMPLIYSGQEAGSNKQLLFFEKDLIEWKEHPHFDLYQTLLLEKKRNKALWNGHFGGEMIRINHSNPDQVLSFLRKKEENEVFVIVNYSPLVAEVTLNSPYPKGTYRELFTDEEAIFSGSETVRLQPWGYQVWVK